MLLLLLLLYDVEFFQMSVLDLGSFVAVIIIRWVSWRFPFFRGLESIMMRITIRRRCRCCFMYWWWANAEYFVMFTTKYRLFSLLICKERIKIAALIHRQTMIIVTLERWKANKRSSYRRGRADRFQWQCRVVVYQSVIKSKCRCHGSATLTSGGHGQIRRNPFTCAWRIGKWVSTTMYIKEKMTASPDRLRFHDHREASMIRKKKCGEERRERERE